MITYNLYFLWDRGKAHTKNGPDQGSDYYNNIKLWLQKKTKVKR